MRERLLCSNAALQDGSHDPRLVAALQAALVDVSLAFVVHCIPDQAEDFYCVLIDPRWVLIVEVPRGEGEVRTELRSLSHWSATKECRRQIDLALKLREERLSDIH